MRGDLEVITKAFPKKNGNVLRVYAIGDVHVGSPEFDESIIRKKLRIIEEDPCGCLVLCGDLGNFGLKSSVSNVYKEKLTPDQQIEFLYELFLPVKDKITACVPGNHEERLVREVGVCPMYDLCVRWGIEDVYRENVAITKYSFGQYKTNQQIVFVGITSHGSTRNKHRKFTADFDNVDFGCSGHVHTPSYTPTGRIRVDRNSGTARWMPYKEIVVDSSMTVGGYALKKEYEVAPPPELQYLELSIVREASPRRTVHRVMNFHSVQI